MEKFSLEPYLEDLENRIDENVENELFANWLDFAEGKHKGGKFVPGRPEKNQERIEWPEINITNALDDYGLMMLSEYASCSGQLENGKGDLLCVRANYGTSILPSLFGVELFIMDEKYNTLPTSKPLPGGTDALKKLIDRGVPDIFGGYGEKVFEMGRRFQDIAKAYPKIGRHVHVYHPDMQGPMDICEVLAGSGIFYTIADEPELFSELLSLITETYIKFMKEWQKVFAYNGKYAVHWGWLHRGCIMLRSDSLMNLSPSTYEEFIMPCDQKLLDTFGGGAMHFCGRGDHFIDLVANLEGLYAVNMSQPEYNNLEKYFKNTVQKGITVLNFKEKAAPGYPECLGQLQNLVHCP
ncbi:MAG: hypothetical protein PHD46_07275 [Eubacteriales bacterium]|nr:hypothetical protein [Eubacteriales bacterium]